MKITSLYKKIFLISSDLLIITFALSVAFSLRLEQIYYFWQINPVIYFIYFTVFFLIFKMQNIYKTLLRYFDFHSVIKIFKSTLICSVILIITNFLLYEKIYFPRSISFIAPIFITLLILSHRIFINFIINLDKKKNNKNNNILIFGINDKSVNLINSLRNYPEYGYVKLIVDISDAYKKRELNGIKIYKNKDLLKLIQKNFITEIIISHKSMNSHEIENLYRLLNDKNIRIRNLVNVKDSLDYQINHSLETDKNFHQIINKPKIEVDKKVLKKKLYNKNILVTGGGGSIGSALCIEILKHNPKKLFILDSSEISLYNINNKLEKIYKNKIKIILGDCNDLIFLNNCFADITLDEIYHAAAYKHVNLGENNIYSMIKNNIFGTKNIIELAVNKKIKDFIFISSDKAVNPKSILGHSKKFGEYLVAHYFLKKIKSQKINFTIVRFGNVIASSGSVLPLFLKQIKNRIPLTVTHKNVKRYFMSISEAVQLVINSSFLNKNGMKIYALNMGEQIKIYDIAKRIILLSGFTNKDKKNPNGDIKIKIIGLSKGEKLSEEITLGKNLNKTNNPKIMICNEKLEKIDIGLRILNLKKIFNSRKINTDLLIDNIKL
jgi:FlaA1/EpsC-like NDP-sugar epimerase